MRVKNEKKEKIGHGDKHKFILLCFPVVKRCPVSPLTKWGIKKGDFYFFMI